MIKTTVNPKLSKHAAYGSRANTFARRCRGANVPAALLTECVQVTSPVKNFACDAIERDRSASAQSP